MQHYFIATICLAVFFTSMAKAFPAHLKQNDKMGAVSGAMETSPAFGESPKSQIKTGGHGVNVIDDVLQVQAANDLIQGNSAANGNQGEVATLATGILTGEQKQKDTQGHNN